MAKLRTPPRNENMFWDRIRSLLFPLPGTVLGGAATCSEGFVKCFLRVPRVLGCTAAAMLPKQTRETFRKHITKLRNKWPSHPVSIVDHRSSSRDFFLRSIILKDLRRVLSTGVLPHKSYISHDATKITCQISYIIIEVKKVRFSPPYSSSHRWQWEGTGVGLPWVQHHGRDRRGTPDGFQHHYIRRINVIQRLKGNY